MMIMPILTYSSTIKTNFNPTQLKRFTSLEKRAENIIGLRHNSSKCIKDCIDAQICSLVKKCLHKKLNHNILDDYFVITNHSKHTRNNNCSLRLPPIKLEVTKQSFYYGGAKIFNALPIDERKSLLCDL